MEMSLLGERQGVKSGNELLITSVGENASTAGVPQAHHCNTVFTRKVHLLGILGLGLLRRMEAGNRLLSTQTTADFLSQGPLSTSQPENLFLHRGNI